MTKLPMPFNNPTTYKGHSGVDFGQREGTPILASDSGVVSWIGSNTRGGNFIWVKYDSIAPRVGHHHLVSHKDCPPVGSRFNAGDVIGRVGTTGNSTGPHLHSEVEGYATTDGYWKFFDNSRVIGDMERKDNEEMIVNIVGKAGHRRGGSYYIADGVATFLGGNVGGALTLNSSQSDNLATRVKGL